MIYITIISIISIGKVLVVVGEFNNIYIDIYIFIYISKYLGKNISISMRISLGQCHPLSSFPADAQANAHHRAAQAGQVGCSAYL